MSMASSMRVPTKYGRGGLVIRDFSNLSRGVNVS